MLCRYHIPVGRHHVCNSRRKETEIHLQQYRPAVHSLQYLRPFHTRQEALRLLRRIPNRKLISLLCLVLAAHRRSSVQGRVQDELSNVLPGRRWLEEELADDPDTGGVACDSRRR